MSEISRRIKGKDLVKTGLGGVCPALGDTEGERAICLIQTRLQLCSVEYSSHCWDRDKAGGEGGGLERKEVGGWLKLTNLLYIPPPKI